VAGIVVGVALAGLLVSFGVPSRPAAAPAARYPWTGPVDTVRQLVGTLADPLLATTIGASVFIWFVGSVGILILNPLGIQQFGLSNSLTSGLVVVQLVGLAAGGLIGARLSSGERWTRLLGPSAVLMSVMMLAVAAVPLLPAGAQVAALFAAIALMGLFGGMFLIPVESFIQVRPPPHRKGAILAAANFVVFSGILISGLLSNILNECFRPTSGFGVLGAASLATSAILLVAYRRLEAR
jgi:predicted MFS family arabinose efflux permease